MSTYIKHTNDLRRVIVSTLLLTCLSFPLFAATEEWARKFNSSYYNSSLEKDVNSYYEGGNSVTTDAAGNIYVTGYTNQGVTNSYDFLTIKYSPTGEQLWVSQYDGRGDIPTSGTSRDGAIAIKADTEGNVYVTGNTYDNRDWQTLDVLTLKLSADTGETLWAQRYDGSTLNDDGSVFRVIPDTVGTIELDDTGNIYVGGQSNRRPHVIKYAPNGTLLWSTSVPDSGGSNNNVTTMALDSSNNVYIAGTFYTQQSGYVAKFNADGSFAKRVGSSALFGLALDVYGNVYTAGRYTFNQTNYIRRPDLQLQKFDADLTSLWLKSYERDYTDGEFVGESKHATSFGIDALGNGYTTLQTGPGIHTVKVSPEGGLLWEKYYQALDNSWVSPTTSTVSPNGNVTATGRHIFPGSDNIEFLTWQYDTDGNFLWDARLNGSATKPDIPSSITETSSGDIIVTGSSLDDTLNTSTAPTINTGYDVQTVKYSVNRAPIAYAGEDRDIACTGNQTVVQLDGTGSTDPDGDELTYLWSGAIDSSSPTPTANLAVGSHYFLLTVNDGNQGDGADELYINMVYQFDGFLSPLKPDGVYKQGRVLPVKIGLSCSGATITDAAPTISVIKLNDSEPIGEPLIIESSSAADNGITFRYSDGKYIYNLDTRLFDVGSYQLRVDLKDGSAPKTLNINLKQLPPMAACSDYARPILNTIK